jgi:hypothetical protein
MNKDQAIGVVLLVASLVGVAVYAWLLYAYSIVVLQITAFVAVGAVLVILAWIGWTLATTRPPGPLEPEVNPMQSRTSRSSEERPPETTSKSWHSRISAPDVIGVWNGILRRG